MKLTALVFRCMIVGQLWTTACLAEEVRPNFILINIDDLGYADIAPFGGNNKTPHLSRMAQEGLKLLSHYAAPVCSPSRASLMTGCYPKRVLPIPSVLFPAASVGLSPDEQTVAEVLKGGGYTTACIGKWHLGDQVEFLPRKQGFDYFFGLPYSNDMGPSTDGTKSNLNAPLPVSKPRANQKDNPDPPTGIVKAIQPPLCLMENDHVIERVRGPEQQTLTRRYTEKAIAFIQQNKEKPFFIYLPHTAVHFPFYPAPDFVGKSPNGLRGDWIEEIDHSVGQILQTVRDLDLSPRTLVVFTSDNGGPINYQGNNTPLQGGKGTTWEGGVRVVTMAWWPGTVPANKSTDAITCMADILPTFAHLANVPLASRGKLDGVDISSVLKGAHEPTSPRQEFFFYHGLKLNAVRSGSWKLHLAKEELFNLTTDIGEQQNLASQNPDVVKKLWLLAKTMEGDLGLDDVGPGCRTLGKVEQPTPLLDEHGAVRPENAGPIKTFR